MHFAAQTGLLCGTYPLSRSSLRRFSVSSAASCSRIDSSCRAARTTPRNLFMRCGDAKQIEPVVTHRHPGGERRSPGRPATLFSQDQALALRHLHARCCSPAHAQLALHCHASMGLASCSLPIPNRAASSCDDHPSDLTCRKRREARPLRLVGPRGLGRASWRACAHSAF